MLESGATSAGVVRKHRANAAVHSLRQRQAIRKKTDSVRKRPTEQRRPWKKYPIFVGSRRLLETGLTTVTSFKQTSATKVTPGHHALYCGELPNATYGILLPNMLTITTSIQKLSFNGFAITLRARQRARPRVHASRQRNFEATPPVTSLW